MPRQSQFHTEFPQTSVIRVIDAASECKAPKYMSGNISHFKKLKMKYPITALMAESEDNDDSMSLSCDLMTTYPGHSHDTYIIAVHSSVGCFSKVQQATGSFDSCEAGPSVGDNKGDGSYPQSTYSRICVLWMMANRPGPAIQRLFGLKQFKLKLVHDLCDGHTSHFHRMPTAIDNGVIELLMVTIQLSSVIHWHSLVGWEPYWSLQISSAPCGLFYLFHTLL